LTKDNKETKETKETKLSITARLSRKDIARAIFYLKHVRGVSPTSLSQVIQMAILSMATDPQVDQKAFKEEEDCDEYIRNTLSLKNVFNKKE